MQSIFFKIYGGMILTVLIVVFIANATAIQVNHFRLENYIRSISSGTFSLIEDAMQRHEPQQQQQWLDVVEKLSSIKIDLLDLQTQSFSARELEQLDQGLLLVKADDAGSKTDIYKSLADEPKWVLHTQISDINEQLARLTALLIVNEIQRQEELDVSEVLNTLNQRFDFSLNVIPTEQLQLSYAQMRLLQRKEMVIHLQESTFALPAISVYSPLPGRDDILQFGPVELFEWAPKKPIYALVFISFSVITGICYLLIRPLQIRLNRMAKEVAHMGGNASASGRYSVRVTGNDVLTQLGENINAMAGRIQSLLSAQKELTRAVSHELRTPIARINFHLAILEEHLQPHLTAKHQKYIDGIYQDADDLEALVDEILSYATLEQAQPELNIARINLSQELALLVEELVPIRPDIDFISTLADDIYVLVDRHYFMRACKNLLVNAQRHAKKQVQISLSQQSGNFKLVVDDDGLGIAKQDRVAIFEPFKRLDASRNRASGGYGLGLAIVFQIMRWHHGRVDVDDAPIGGSRFILQWPREK
ncbi:MAG: hypothetical protein HRU20_15580 [Pseudomonadales bacterium]|nr:hypothetical protein [Pseudomonadales bacterium]